MKSEARYGVRKVIIGVLMAVVLLYLFSVPIAYVVSFSMWGSYVLMAVRFLLTIAISVIIRKKCQTAICSNESKRKKFMSVFLACDIITLCLYFGNVTRKFLWNNLSDILEFIREIHLYFC